MLQFKIANCAAERQGAFRLLYANYLRQGLGEPNPYEMRVTPFHLLDATTTFVAKLQHEVVATLTLVADGELGLPLEAMYGPEVQRRRSRVVPIAEVSCLADRRKSPSRFLGTFMTLSKLMAQYARRQGVDELLAAVHPRHAWFYRRYLGFEKFAGLAQCPHVQGKPAVGLRLSLPQFARHNRAVYDMYFAEHLPESMFARQGMSVEERCFYMEVCRDIAPVAASELADPSVVKMPC